LWQTLRFMQSKQGIDIILTQLCCIHILLHSGCHMHMTYLVCYMMSLPICLTNILYFGVLLHVYILHLTSLTSYLLGSMECTYSSDPQQWKLTRSYNFITRFLNLYTSSPITTWVTGWYYGQSRTCNTKKMQIHTNLAKDRKRPSHSCKNNIKTALWYLRHDDRYLIGLGLRSSGSLLRAR